MLAGQNVPEVVSSSTGRPSGQRGCGCARSTLLEKTLPHFAVRLKAIEQLLLSVVGVDSCGHLDQRGFVWLSEKNAQTFVYARRGS